MKQEAVRQTDDRRQHHFSVAIVSYREEGNGQLRVGTWATPKRTKRRRKRSRAHLGHDREQVVEFGAEGANALVLDTDTDTRLINPKRRPRIQTQIQIQV